jgi:hypothetical protein
VSELVTLSRAIPLSRQQSPGSMLTGRDEIGLLILDADAVNGATSSLTAINLPMDAGWSSTIITAQIQTQRPRRAGR